MTSEELINGAEQPRQRDSAPVGIVRIQHGYWSRGHYYDVERPFVELLSLGMSLKAGAHLYTAQPDLAARVARLEGLLSRAQPSHSHSIKCRDSNSDENCLRCAIDAALAKGE